MKLTRVQALWPEPVSQRAAAKSTPVCIRTLLQYRVRTAAKYRAQTRAFHGLRKDLAEPRHRDRSSPRPLPFSGQTTLVKCASDLQRSEGQFWRTNPVLTDARLAAKEAEGPRQATHLTAEVYRSTPASGARSTAKRAGISASSSAQKRAGRSPLRPPQVVNSGSGVTTCVANSSPKIAAIRTPCST